MGPFTEDLPESAQNVTVNVPKNTPSNVVGDILENLPNILGSLSALFGKKEQEQQQQAPAQDLTPIYILGGLALIILLTRK